MREPFVIADSGPLIALARIGQLDLLPTLCERIIIPVGVWEEVTVTDPEAPGAEAVRSVTWLEVQTAPAPLVSALSILVDRGEAEAIALAQTVEHSLLVADDARARRVAERLGIRRIGTVGLLRRAKQAGLIGLLHPQLEALQKNGIYIREALIKAVLREVGE